MTTFNKALTIEEAKAILTFKGAAMWPDTAHNRAMMAKLMHEQLKSLQKK